MRATKKKASRFLAVLLAVLMVINVVPAGMIPQVVKAADGCKVVEVGEKRVYLYGVTDVGKITEESKSYYVPYTGEDIQTFEVWLDGVLDDNNNNKVQKNDTVIQIDKQWLKNQDKWIAIKCNADSVVPADEPAAENPDITGITITAYNKPYDGESHDAVTVEGQKKDDTVTYSTDGGTTYSDEMPQLQTPEQKNVIVKIDRDGYHSYISKEYQAVVANGQITGIQVTPYQGAYDFDMHEAVKVEGMKAGDIVQYSVNNGATYSQDVPMLTAPEKLSVKVKVSREYYDDFETTVTAEVTKATIKGITVKAYAGVYDGLPHDAVQVTGTKPGDVVYYSIDEEQTYTTDVPQVTNATDGFRVFVKVVRENYADWVTFPDPAIAKVDKAEIEGVSAKGFKGQLTWNIFLNGAPTVTMIYEDGVNPDEFEVTYYKKDKDENSAGQSSPVYLHTKWDEGNYTVRVHHKSGNYEDLIIRGIEVRIQKMDQEIFFKEEPQIPEIFIYGKNNSFQYQIDETKFAEESEGAVTYDIDEKAKQNRTKIDKTTGKVTFKKTGPITVTATKAADSKYNAAKKSYTINVVYVQVPEYTVMTPIVPEGVEGYDWYRLAGERAYSVTAPEGWQVMKIASKQDEDDILDLDGWAQTVTETEEAVYDNYKVAFKNIASGAVTEVVTLHKFAIDNTKPTVEHIEFSKKNDGVIAKVIHFLSFGLFYDESIQVNVQAADEPGTRESLSAGLKDIKLYQYNAAGEKVGEIAQDDVDLDKGTAEFTLDLGFEGTVKAEIIDKVGNTSGEVLANKDNSNIGNENETGYIMLEDNDPEVSEIIDTPLDDARKDSEKKLYSGDIQFEFTVKDTESGLNSVTAVINEGDENEKVYNLYESPKTQDRGAHTYTINTEKLEADDNGMYHLEVKVIDNAGNVTTKTTTVVKDTTSATIKGFEFSLDKNIDVDNKGGIYEAVEATDYGFYFKQPVTVTILAEDIKSEKEAMSGVDTITYQAIDIDGTAKYQGTKEVDDNDKIEFTIGGDFKGQIYAYATDMIGNNPLTAKKIPEGYVYDKATGFVHPNGSIIESEGKHTETSAIDFTMPKAVGTQNNSYSYAYTGNASADQTMDYDVSQKAPLYNADFTMGIDVTDTYSGIREMKWTLMEGETATVKTITVDNEGAISGDTEGWTLTKEEGSNLVTGLSNKAISVSGNYNNMVMLVELTDRAGNRSYDYYAFGIDKTAPKIEVTYDNNSADTSSNDGNAYFKADRTATIVISERNFNADQVVTVVTRDGQKIAVNSSWATAAGTGNGDDTTHRITIPYSTDGDYTFSIQYTDRATNPNTPVDYKGSVAPEKFTVDKTLPTIHVSYNNNAARNGKYFKEHRTATIVVTEHNFDVSRVRFTQTASLGGSAIGIPGISWTHNGDVHTATIPYTTDGDYTFDVTMDDMAGNKSPEANYGSSVAGKDFTVDTKITKPVITGIENGKAYKDAVIPGINFEDINFDTDEIKLTRTRKNEKDVDVTEEFIKYITKTATGISGVNDTFEDKQENDGIYTLYVKTTDKAGNEESETITFTVNRYGSVYVFSDYLMDLIADGGAYVQNVKEDLMITEYNPDKLVEKSLAIEITCDGKPVSDVKFDVSPVINDQVKVGESGWYQYEYTISKENFKEDGVYKMAVSSKDATGNTPENTNYDELGILFRVDTTAPEITSIVGLEESIINAQEAPVKYDVYDTIGLKSVSVYVDDELVGNAVTDFNGDLNNYEGDFKIQESNAQQKVRLVVEDLAGNVTDTDSKEFSSEYVFEKAVTVSTNWFVRWYANKVLFWSTVGGAIAVLGGLIFFIVFKKKKEEEEEVN